MFVRFCGIVQFEKTYFQIALGDVVVKVFNANLGQGGTDTISISIPSHNDLMSCMEQVHFIPARRT